MPKSTHGVVEDRRIEIHNGTGCIVCGYKATSYDLRQSIIYVDCPNCDNVIKFTCDMEEAFDRSREYQKRRIEQKRSK